MALRPYQPPSYSQPPSNILSIASAAPWMFKPDRHNYVDIQREGEQLIAQELANQKAQEQIEEDALRKQAYGEYIQNNPQGNTGDFYGGIADVLASAGLGEDSIKMREKGENRSYRDSYRQMQATSMASKYPPGPERDAFLSAQGIDPALLPPAQNSYQITSRGIYSKDPYGGVPELVEGFPEKQKKGKDLLFVDPTNPLSPDVRVDSGDREALGFARQNRLVPKDKYIEAKKMNDEGNDNVLEPDELIALLEAQGHQFKGRLPPKLKDTTRKDY